MRRFARAAIALAVVVVTAAGMYTLVKFAYGGFADYYDVSFNLPRAGQQLAAGSDVRMRGVVIGKVTNVALDDRAVHVTLQIEQRYRVPASSQAFVDLTTLLGAKFIDLRFDRYAPPFLHDGSVIQTAHVGPELEDALADGVNVLDAIRPTDLATVVSELAKGAQGHGEDVARSIRANAELSGVFASTLKPQIESLHDFATLFGRLRTEGPTLNSLADAINQGVPVYASTEAQLDLRRALEALTPFANNFADLLIFNRADWDRLMDAGDTVLQTIADHRGGLHDLVHGLYRYVFKLGGDPCREGHGPPNECDLRDGSGSAGFTNFMGGTSNEESLKEFCDALPTAVRDQIPLCEATSK